MKKLLSAVLAATLALSLFAGCAPKVDAPVTPPADPGTTQPEQKPAAGGKVGYAISNLNDTFQTFVHGAAKTTLEGLGYTMDTADAQEDVVKQQDQVNTFITQGVSALIVVPVDTSAMEPITKAAQEAKIPLVYVNRNPYAEKEMPEGVYYVGSQEIVAGELQAEAAGKLLNGKGGVVILMGILGNEGALKRTEGVETKMAELYPDVKILTRESGNWQADQGMTLTENWLTAYGDGLNAILANNDEMALGAIKALDAAGRKDVIVMGVDAIQGAKDAVAAGTMAATVLQDAEGQGGGAAKVIDTVIKGNTAESITWVPFVLVDSTNIANYK